MRDFASILIAGPLSGPAIEALVDAALLDGVDDDQGNTVPDAEALRDLVDQAIMTGEPVQFIRFAAEDGEFFHIERACVEAGLRFRRHVDPAGEEPGLLVEYDPVRGVYRGADYAGGEPVIGLTELADALEGGETLDALVAGLRALTAPFPGVVLNDGGMS